MKTLEKRTVGTLNRQQANALTIYLNYKKYHWLTFGPLFRDVHLLFDEHASQVLAMVDEFAERSLMIDGSPLADPQEYLPAATVKPSRGKQTLRQMVEEAVENLEAVIRELHDDTKIASNEHDIGTADLYTRLVQDYQKQRWFLRELLRTGDALTG